MKAKHIKQRAASGAHTKMKRNTKKETYYTIGVRFLSGDVGRVFTYRVRTGKAVHLGQELVADTPRGPALVVVVRIDKTRQDTGPYEYKYITRKVATL